MGVEGALHEGIAGEQHAVPLIEQADAVGAMAGRVDHPQLAVAEIDLITLAKQRRRGNPPWRPSFGVELRRKITHLRLRREGEGIPVRRHPRAGGGDDRREGREVAPQQVARRPTLQQRAAAKPGQTLGEACVAADMIEVVVGVHCGHRPVGQPGDQRRDRHDAGARIDQKGARGADIEPVHHVAGLGDHPEVACDPPHHEPVGRHLCAP